MSEATTKIEATRRLQYAIGHRVHLHESKCRHLHGHNFVFFLTAQAPQLDAIGRVIDFGVLKQRFGTWLETNWDHGFVLWEQDEEAIAAVRMVSGQKLFRLPYNPTAENLAAYLLETIGPMVLAGTDVTLTRVRVFETENGIAEAFL
jgi:6-pyruvoyltetrahydropterin/6-carboxytetrahydropterin synthase